MLQYEGFRRPSSAPSAGLVASFLTAEETEGEQSMVKRSPNPAAAMQSQSTSDAPTALNFPSRPALDFQRPDLGGRSNSSSRWYIEKLP
ncbi:hypothetical protein SLE2022_359160 [Rubroshorea leprosula]